jgi:ligand-binding sensor domain-containing protein/DNA-binding CsgD family transcriptional regulator
MRRIGFAGLVVGIWLCAVLPARSSPGRFFRFERLIPENRGTVVTGISSILQDGEGFLWFGTAAGLSRYDGYRFDFYSPRNGDGELPASVVVYPAIEDAEGEIWIGTHGEGLLRLDRSRRKFVRYRHDPGRTDSLSGDIVLSVAEDKTGDLWVGTRLNGLNRFDRRTDSFVPFPLDPEAAGIWDLLVDGAGDLWIATQEAGLFRVDRETGDTVNYRFILDNPRSLGSNTVWTLYEDRGGTLWVGTSGGGLNAYDPGTDSFFRYVGSGEVPRDLARTTITAVSEDEAGRLWIGTSGIGLRVWDRKTGEYTTCRHDPRDPETLGNDHISSIHMDASGIMWVGTVRGGIGKCLADEVKFQHLKRNRFDPRSLGRDDVRALHVSESGQLWVGLDQGLDRVDRRRDVVTHFDLRVSDGDGRGPGAVLAVREDRRGGIWMGTESGGLVRLDPRSGALLAHRRDPGRPDGLANNRVNALSLDRENPHVLWIGTNSGLNRFDTLNGDWRRFSHDPSDPASLTGNLVRAVAEGGNGFLWIGTNAGLNRMDKATGRCVRYVHDIQGLPGTGLGNNIVQWILPARDGSLWVGTEGGMSRFGPGRNEWRSFTTAEGLPGNVVCGILEDETGRLWLSTNRGLSRFDPETREFTNFRLHDGIQGFLYNLGACAKASDGEMFFGGTNGLNAFHPASVRPNPFVPPVVWTKLSRENRDLGLGGPFVTDDGLMLNYKLGFVTLEFAALSYLAPEENRFAYQLEPRDEGWTDMGPDHAVSLSTRSAGRYRLRVRAANPDGVWNEEGLEIPIEIIPPFWRTRLFTAVAALFFVSGVLSVVRMWRKLKAASAVAGANVGKVVEKYRLTPREEEVLRLIVEGAGNKDIEKKLFISASTVRNHIYNIYQKLGVKNRLELINLIGRITP